MIYYLHEERHPEDSLSFNDHIEEDQLRVPLNAQPFPATFAERGEEEKMHCCFFHGSPTCHTTLVGVQNAMFMLIHSSFTSAKSSEFRYRSPPLENIVMIILPLFSSLAATYQIEHKSEDHANKQVR
jgi:hypothetical protein